MNILKLNGSLSAFCDVQFRSKIIWSTEQLLSAYINSLSEGTKAISESDLKNQENLNNVRKYLDRRLLSHQRNKLELIVEAIYTYQYKEKVSDIRYGWALNAGRGGASRMKKSDLPPIEDAFTVEHVNKYIPICGHYESLLDLLKSVSTSHIEKIFYKAWYKRFYSSKSPALIPEVHRFSLSNESCGNRSFKYENDLGKPVFGRVDFFVYNARKQLAYFIELDGHMTHKTKEQRKIDALKRNIAAKAEIPTIVFTAQMILDSVDSCLDDMAHVFES